VTEQQPDVIRFYFSFRSPYSWLAWLRVDEALQGLGVTLKRFPVFPPPNFPNDPAAVPNKLAYVQKDTARIAEAYGLTATPPSKLDTDWVRPHAAYLYAEDQGKGREFGRALYEARFVRGLDVGENAVMAETARALSLDAGALLAAADDVAHQTRVVQGMIQAATEDAIFGVPLFVFRGETFWGNDRIEWLVRAIRKTRGLPVVDLRGNMNASLDR